MIRGWCCALLFLSAISSDEFPARHAAGANPSSVQPRLPFARPNYAPGQIIVKFKSSLTECAHCLLGRNRAFATALSDGSTSLDELNRRYRVGAGRSVFVEREKTTTAAAQAAESELRQSVNRKFRKRSLRAGADSKQTDLTNVYVLSVPQDTDVEAMSREYAADPHVEYAQPNYLISIAGAPNDPYFSSSNSWGQGVDDLWGLKKIGAPAAWDVAQGQGITVAVVDSGVDYTHPDIAANVGPGWNFLSNSSDAMDDHGHGTFVAGIIASVGNNGLGIIGVAPLARIMPLKAFDKSGLAYSDVLALAIVYAAQHGADVINNSWACENPGCGSNPIAEDAVRSAYGFGAVTVFAAGNDRLNTVRYSPQNMTDAKPVVVAATTPSDGEAIFSNNGVLVDVAAPGTGILSLRSSVCEPSLCDPAVLVGDRYLHADGTSAAAPHASGVAALVLSHHSDFTNEEVRQILRASADPIGFDRMPDVGRINALRALAMGSVPEAEISSPSPLSSYALIGNPIVEVRGTAAGADFTQYQLFYAAASNTDVWIPASGAVTTPVHAGVLGSILAIGLPVDLYLLKLVCLSSAGVSAEAFSQFAVEPGITRLSTPPAYELSPWISGSRIVWTHTYEDPNLRFHDGGWHQYAGDIYLYEPGGTARAITTSGHAALPNTSNERVAFVDFRSGFENGFNGEIYVYDLVSNTEKPIALGPALRTDPVISGNHVVWLEIDDPASGAPYTIRLYDLATDTTRQITSDAARPLTSGLYGDIAISGDKVVWVDNRNGLFDSDVYVYDLASNTERQLTHSGKVNPPAGISGDRIAWVQDNGDVLFYDFATDAISPVTTTPGNRIWPRISGDRVVWTEWRLDNWDIYSFDLTSNTEQQITSQSLDQVYATISGDTAVWMDDRGGSHVYMYRFLSQRSPPHLLRPRPHPPTVKR